MKFLIIVSLIVVGFHVKGILSGPLSGTLENTANNPTLEFTKSQDSETTVYLLDSLNKFSHHEMPHPPLQAFTISSPVSSLRPPASPQSELTQVLPQMFHFMESMMVIMSNFARPAELQVHHHHYYHHKRPAFQYPEDFSRYEPMNFIYPTPDIPNHISPIDQYYKYISEQEQFEISRRTGNPFLIEDLAGRSGDEDESSVRLSKHLSKYCVFQGVSTFYPYDCFKYLLCIPTKYNRFEAFLALCPSDKRFSSTYRRCVQPYLVPECFQGPHSKIVVESYGNKMGHLVKYKNSETSKEDEEVRSLTEYYAATTSTPITPLITSKPTELSTTIYSDQGYETLPRANQIPDSHFHILPSQSPASYTTTTAETKSIIESTPKLEDSSSTAPTPILESYTSFTSTLSSSPEAQDIEYN